MFNKKGSSFGTIIAVFGSVLIALGFAWIIAQNWHQIPSFLKILILLIITSSSYTVGIIMCTKGFDGIGKALLVLGALIYSLSIFLIAQIFSTSTSFQGQAWLWLLAWVGVVITAYIFDSSSSLIVGLVELCVWIIIQFIAFADKYEQSYGVLALYFLVIGVFFYGLALIHRSFDHKFGKLYLIWTAFYFMSLTYILSFQTALPYLWSEGIQFSSAIIFLVFITVLSIISLVIGIMFSSKNRTVHRNELIGVIGLMVFLIILISSAGTVSSAVGACNEKQCYDIKDKDLCLNNKLQTKCDWTDNTCTYSYKNCYVYNDENSCSGNSCVWTPVTKCEEKSCSLKQTSELCVKDVNCKWSETYCEEKESCSYLVTQQDCESSSNLNCEWLNNFCSKIQQTCYNYKTQNSCEKFNCEWSNTGQCSNDYNSKELINCYSFRDTSACNSAKGCKWNDYSNYCEVIRPCEEFLNNKDSCKQHQECQWQQGSSYYFGYGRSETPISLWVMWIFSNIIFILLILGVIGYGTWQKIPTIINLGIIFFSLDILTRYIGFAMDLWGYTGLSVIFIAGGLTLLASGYFIEKWRRKLVAQVKN